VIGRAASKLDPEQEVSRRAGNSDTAFDSFTDVLTHALTYLRGTSFARQESQTLRTRVAALESTGSEGLAQLVRGADTREAEGS
jgi:hypothetical protein